MKIRSALALFALSALTFLVTYWLKSASDVPFLYSLIHPSPELTKGLWLLPLATAFILAARSHVPEWAVVGFYLAFFALISPTLAFAIALIGVTISFFLIEDSLPRKGKFAHGWGLIIPTFTVLLAYAPVLLYTLELRLSFFQFFCVIVFKASLAMRMISWVVHKRVYKRTTFPTLREYLEFLYCPVFFVAPGQIQFFLYDYFHQSKTLKGSGEHGEFRSLALALWGLALMVLFSFMSYFFTHTLFSLPGAFEGLKLWLLHFAFGFYWLIAIYFQQTAGMSYQVGIARLMGYRFKYDMHWPLLARSPIDYLRRHSSYVRDYIVEVGLKPTALPLIRRDISPYLVYPLMSFVSYAVFIGAQTGYRTDTNRPWLETLGLIVFLLIYLILPTLKQLFRKLLNRPSSPATTLASGLDEKPIRRWTAYDYLAWIGTLSLLSLSKAVLGLARVVSIQN